MGHSIVERFGGGVLAEAQDLAAVDPGQAAGSSDQQEPQGAHAPKGEGVGALPRTRLDRGERLELEAAHEIVGEDAQVLPGAVRAVVVGGHHIEGELALEFPVGLLLGAPARDEGPAEPVNENETAGS
jgi:hypothetical protein